MKRPRQLSASFVAGVKTPGRYGDGPGSHGLSVLVKNTSTKKMSKTWAQRLRIRGQLTSIGLGSFPVVTLATARKKALENARLIAEGGDPRTPPIVFPTFAQAVNEAAAPHSEGNPVRDFWENRVPGIRTKLEERAPGLLPRFEQLASLKANLDALKANLDTYSEALESSIIGCDPDKPYPEAVFGDVPMNETIRLLRTLPTMQAAIPQDVTRRAGERG